MLLGINFYLVVLLLLENSTPNCMLHYLSVNHIILFHLLCYLWF